MNLLAWESHPHPNRGKECGNENYWLLLIHYCLPVALGWSLAMVFRRDYGVAFSPAGLTLLLTGIGAAYSFDRIVDEPSRGITPGWLRGILLSLLILCAGTICLLVGTGNISSNSVQVIAVLTGISLLYPSLKRIPLVKTVAVALSWIWACSTLPLAGVSQHGFLLDVTAPLILMISAGCILCDLKDLSEDQQQNVPSLPALMGIRNSCLIATGLALLAAFVALLHHRFALTTGALLLAVAAQFPTLLRMRSAGPILIDSILIIPGALIAIRIF